MVSQIMPFGWALLRSLKTTPPENYSPYQRIHLGLVAQDLCYLLNHWRNPNPYARIEMRFFEVVGALLNTERGAVEIAGTLLRVTANLLRQKPINPDDRQFGIYFLSLAIMLDDEMHERSVHPTFVQ